MESQENMNGKEILKVENITANKLSIEGFWLEVEDEKLTIKTPNKTAGIEIDKQGNIRTIGRVSYEE